MTDWQAVLWQHPILLAACTRFEPALGPTGVPAAAAAPALRQVAVDCWREEIRDGSLAFPPALVAPALASARTALAERFGEEVAGEVCRWAALFTDDETLRRKVLVDNPTRLYWND